MTLTQTELDKAVQSLNDDPSMQDEPKSQWKCLACPMTSDDVERLFLDDHNYKVTYDPELHLCSRCKPDLTSVTLALAEAIVLAHVDADGSVIERLENLERHVLEASEEGTLDVEPEHDQFDEHPDNDAPDKRYEESIRLVEALWEHRDSLVAARTVDTFAARYSETNEVLNRQWGAISEVRKLLGLDVRADATNRETKRAMLGALGGALAGFALGLSPKDPLETLKLAVGWLRDHLGVEL